MFDACDIPNDQPALLRSTTYSRDKSAVKVSQSRESPGCYWPESSGASILLAAVAH